MITLERLRLELRGLDAAELERWIAEQWVRPDRRDGDLVFRDIDVARVRLIVELRQELSLAEEAVPVVLSLVDQLYATRRQLRALCEAVERSGGEDLARDVARDVARQLGEA